MSLFGALSSGVSGLTAQSSAMGAISDNITNVSTVGYKNTTVNFQTLVTKQTSSTLFSAGGVQSAPRSDTSVQGLLQATTSQTDIAISGSGFFVVNTQNQPTATEGTYLFTRAGSFFQDNQGFLRNTAGFYLQAWPTDASGNVIPANDALSVTNQNVLSPDFLTTVNLSRVGGTATATSSLSVGANLPASADAGDNFSTDVQIFDTLGNPTTLSVRYTKSGIENRWDVSVDPPSGTAVLTLEDSDGDAYSSIGQLEFTALPGDGATVVIEGNTYEFDTDSFSTATSTAANNYTANGTDLTDGGGAWTFADVGSADTITAAAGTFSNVAAGDTITVGGAGANAGTFTVASVSSNGATITVSSSDSLVAEVTGGAGGKTLAFNDFINASPGTFTGISVGDAVRLDFTGGANTDVTSAIVTGISANGSQLRFADNTLSSGGSVTYDNTTTLQITLFNGGTGETTGSGGTGAVRRVDISSSTTVAQAVTALVNTVNGYDTDFDTTNDRIAVSGSNTSTVLFTEDGTRSITVNPAGLLDSNGNPVSTQTSSFTVRKIDDDYSAYTQFTFSTVPNDGETMTLTIGGVATVFTFQSGEAADSTGSNTTVTTAGGVAAMLADLEAAIEAQVAQFAQGADTVRVRQNNNAGSNNTLVLSSLDGAPSGYTLLFSNNFTTAASDMPTTPDGTSTFVRGTPGQVTIQTVSALNFDSSGLPESINIAEAEILGFASGAADMDDASTNSPQISLDFGTIGEADGITQFGADFTPVFITQNGSRFGTFAGVDITQDGLVTALFDNGETRPIFKLPVATFTNTNQLEARTGNVWNATENSGDPTLREADTGPSGQVTQGALEQSTVDIGEEFTDMIVVQRAYSAAARIISTTDEMLEELINVKR